MNIAYHIFCYVLCFVVAIRYVWYGERNTTLNPPKDENDFEQRMVVAGAALVIFTFLHALLTIRTW
jgi:hypothetical protein